MKKLNAILVIALGVFALAGGAAYAGGELAVNTAAPALYDFPVERVHAAVDLYREGGGQEKIAVSALSKLGEAARTELLSMKHAANTSEEAVAISEILHFCAETAAPAPAPAKIEKMEPQPRTKQHAGEADRSKSSHHAAVRRSPLQLPHRHHPSGKKARRKS